MKPFQIDAVFLQCNQALRRFMNWLHFGWDSENSCVKVKYRTSRSRSSKKFQLNLGNFEWLSWNRIMTWLIILSFHSLTNTHTHVQTTLLKSKSWKFQSLLQNCNYLIWKKNKVAKFSSVMGIVLFKFPAFLWQTNSIWLRYFWNDFNNFALDPSQCEFEFAYCSTLTTSYHSKHFRCRICACSTIFIPR